DCKGFLELVNLVLCFLLHFVRHLSFRFELVCAVLSVHQLSQELSGLTLEVVLDFHFQLVYAALGTCQLLLKVGDVLVA
ncbi:hypothetical protein PO909_004559, partial [Leuciscus waleckii]